MFSVFHVGKFKYCSDEPQQSISLSDQPEEIRRLLGLNCLQWLLPAINLPWFKPRGLILSVKPAKFPISLSALPLLLPSASLKHSNMDRGAGGRD